MPPRSSAEHDAGESRRTRRFTAEYKVRVLQDYDSLELRGDKTDYLRRRGLRASQISKWRAQVYAAALEALSADPGGQPARQIHVSHPVWADLTELAATANPPMSPERLARALFSWATGREARLPFTPGRPAQAEEGAPPEPDVPESDA